MDIEIRIKDGFLVEAKTRKHQIQSDQGLESGGEDLYPNPFEYFLSSIGLCAAHYINSFCKQRDIDSKDIKLKQKVSRDEEQKLNISFSLSLPPSFPEKYKDALMKAAGSCTVKKAIESGINFTTKIE